LWTDTAYPGWRAALAGQPVPLRAVAPCFSELEVPAANAPVVLRLWYRPTGWTWTRALAAAGLAGVAGAGLLFRRAPGRGTAG
jgi:hypothetical protein